MILPQAYHPGRLSMVEKSDHGRFEVFSVSPLWLYVKTLCGCCRFRQDNHTFCK
jgi:hypothetical protein